MGEKPRKAQSLYTRTWSQYVLRGAKVKRRRWRRAERAQGPAVRKS